MTTFTAEQIEARALELFNVRKSNIGRRDRWAAEDMRFEGEEREFCIEAAKYRLEQEAHAAARAEAEIAYWSRTSTAALKAMIDQMEAERATLVYGLATHTAIQELDLERLNRMRAEYVRRLQIKIAADDAATDAAMADSAARLADMRALAGADHHAIAAE